MILHDEKLKTSCSRMAPTGKKNKPSDIKIALATSRKVFETCHHKNPCATFKISDICIPSIILNHDILTFCIQPIRLILNYDRTVTRHSADSSGGTTTISKFQVWWMESYDGQRSILKFKAQKREIHLSSRRPPRVSG